MVLSNQTCTAQSLSTNSLKQIIEMITLSIVGFSALIGNCLVIAVISRSHRVQWVTNLFVAHLAIVNLSIPFFAVPFYFHWIFKGAWALGSLSCKLVHFAHYLNAGISVCMLTCMALDRYYVVVHPLTLHLRRSQTFQLITFIWVFIIFISTPALYFYELKTTSCGSVCSVENSLGSWGGFFIVFSLCGFFSPLCILIFLYILVVKAIFERDVFAKKQDKGQSYAAATSKRIHTEGPKCQQKSLGRVPKTKRTVIKMLMIQNAIFLVCWIPYFVAEFSKLWRPSDYDVNTAYLWLSFSNSTINPVLYAIFNSNFRKGCRHLVNLNLSQPYALQALQRRHQVGVTESSHRGSEDEGAIKDYVVLKQSRHTVLFHKEQNAAPQQSEGFTTVDLNSKQLVKIFQASSAGYVDAWA